MRRGLSGAAELALAGTGCHLVCGDREPFRGLFQIGGVDVPGGIPSGCHVPEGEDGDRIDQFDLVPGSSVVAGLRPSDPTDPRVGGGKLCDDRRGGIGIATDIEERVRGVRFHQVAIDPEPGCAVDRRCHGRGGVSEGGCGRRVGDGDVGRGGVGEIPVVVGSAREEAEESHGADQGQNRCGAGERPHPPPGAGWRAAVHPLQ